MIGADEFFLIPGTPPVRYLRELRIQHAVDCLIHTQDSLEEVAERCGFSDRAYFSRVFARHLQRGVEIVTRHERFLRRKQTRREQTESESESEE